jgi:hypothetical protein
MNGVFGAVNAFEFQGPDQPFNKPPFLEAYSVKENQLRGVVWNFDDRSIGWDDRDSALV